MTDLLEITGSDISLLKDNDLRDLIGLLCEADYKNKKLSTKGIYWGGDQDAPDGGFDVYVDHDIPPPIESFLPTQKTGIQVKKPNMPPSEIKKEMCKNGILKPEIKKLINAGGSYIIISSKSSTSKSALDKRLSAMKECISSECANKTGEILFFDQGQVATWVRNHKSLIIWVRNKIGKPISGWQSFSSWSFHKGKTADKFIIDEELKLYTGKRNSDSGESIIDGILKLRNNLSIHNTSTRLVGLSGVGKTRLVEALFDERISENALDKYLAIYTDISDSPLPNPKTLCEEIVRENARAIIIIDNCGPELHRKLTRVITGSGSASLITIEYDVKSDLPEETSVYRLEPASENAIQEFISSRYESISSIDAKSIADFSGGNFRLAIALSNTLKEGDNISELGDQELFNRLFIQRNSYSEGLLLSAMACSLVYSFEGTDASNNKSEISVLSSLIDKSASRLYIDINTLSKRNLIQSRGPWRALLPHALSNRLAKNALEAIPLNKILEVFENSNERLIMSFAHRLSFLYDNLNAQKIALHFFKNNGAYGVLNGKLNYDQIRTFEHLAAVCPSAALELLEFWSKGSASEYFLSRTNGMYYHYTRILKKIAYDINLFSRSIKIIIDFALRESSEERVNSTRNVLKPFFQIELSGTYASLEQRLAVVETLLKSNMKDKHTLGLLLSSSLLKSSYFTGSPFNQFGARKRTYGYRPKSYDEYIEWYIKVIEFLKPFLILKSNLGIELRKHLGDNLRMLILNIGLGSELKFLILELHEKCTWLDGWLGLKSVLNYDKEKIENSELQIVKLLEQKLRPRNLEEKIRMYVLNDQHRVFDIEEDTLPGVPASETHIRIGDKTIKLGELLSNQMELFKKILPELILTKNSRLRYLGRGLFIDPTNRVTIWKEMEIQYSVELQNKKNIALIVGFLQSCSAISPKTHDALMEKIIQHKSPLLEWFPIFQGTKTMDSYAIERIHKSLDMNLTKIDNYYEIGYHNTRGEIEDNDLVSLLNKITLKNEGEKVGLNILDSITYNREKFSQALAQVAYKIICKFDFTANQYPNAYYSLNKVLEATFQFDNFSVINDKTLCIRIANHLNQDVLSSDLYKDILITLAKKQPKILLNAFFSETSPTTSYSVDIIFREERGRLENPINSITTQTLMEWAEINPSARYTILSKSINLVRTKTATGTLEWKPIVYEILSNTETTIEILDGLEYFIHPRSWSGSKAPMLKTRLVLLDSLLNNEKEIIRNWAKTNVVKIEKEIEYWKNVVLTRDRQEMETFE